jgi:branched-chain amino acid transport system substrate-binding protein
MPSEVYIRATGGNMRPVKLIFAASVLVVFAFGSVAFAQAPAPTGQPIRLGLIVPLTGGSSDMGNSARIGAQLAVDEINQAGGYLNRPIQLLVRDDKADPDTGLKAAEELVLREKVSATLGFCNSGVAMKALDVFQKNQSILFVTCATGSAITGKYPTEQSYIFRNSARDALQTQFLINDIVKRGHKRIALLVDSTGYGDAGLKDLETAIGKAGLPAPTVIRFNIGVKSVAEELKQLRQGGVDALIGWTVGPEEGVIAESRAAIGWKVPFFGPWGLSHASAFLGSSGAVEGSYMVQTVLPNVFLERNTSFMLAYSKLSNEKPIGSMMSAAQTYDAVHLLLRAMFAAKGDFSGNAIKAALENLPHAYYGVATTYDKPFSAVDHDAISLNMLWLGTWRGGERAHAYKEDEKRAFVIRRKQS